MKHPPYHLRMNKAIDRFILIELLQKLFVGGFSSINEATYVSFAGPFLEDLKIMNTYFPDMRLVSVEIDEETYKRQVLHKFNSTVILNPFSLVDYLDKNQTNEVEIFWLDYTKLEPSCLIELGQILERVNEGSVVKITLPSDFRHTPFSRIYDHLTKSQRDYLKKFENDYKSLLLGSISSSDFSRPEKYRVLIQSMIKMQVIRSLSAVKGSLRFQILSSNYYNDGTEMLSVTGIIIDKDKMPQVNTYFQDWRLKNLEWNPPRRINIPVLSIKERLKLEEFLPANTPDQSNLSMILGYYIDMTLDDSEESLKQYSDFCKYYPTFVKIVS